MAKHTPTLDDIMAGAERLGRPVSTAEAKLLASYLDQLIKWNRKMNLVGKSTWRDVFNTLIVDSLHLADFLPDLPLPDAPLTLDLGAGAGLPGIPLRALWEKGEYQLVEVREKRTLFMRSVLGKLKLTNTHVFHGRAEDVLATLEKPSSDLILSRAFMPWKKLLEFTRPMLSKNGILVILSNDPPPSPDRLPEGWQLGDTTDYSAAKAKRYFWSLMKA